METICLVVKIFQGCVYIVHAFLERGSSVMNIKYNMLGQEYLPSEYLHSIITPKNDLFVVLDLVSWLLIFCYLASCHSASAFQSGGFPWTAGGLDGWFSTDLLWNRMNITSRWCFLMPSLFSCANCLAHVQGDHGLWEQKAWQASSQQAF